MAKFEPIVFIIFPEPKKMCVDFHCSMLPKWVRLYIIRWYERHIKKAELSEVET